MRLRIPTELAGLRLDQALARLLPEESRTRLARLIEQGHVTVDGQPAAPKLKLRSGEAVDVALVPRVEKSAFVPQAIALAVLHEDDDVLVVDKPAGLVVHPGSGNWSGTLLNALLQHAPMLQQVPRAGIVHRLDKDTSGLLVVAKTLTAQTDLVRQLQARTVRREYAAVVHGTVTRDGVVESPIGRHPVHRTRMAVVPGGKPAVTHYQVVERFAGASHVACRLETGRTHQIRVHLASIGHPLIGDPVYGKRTFNATLEFPRQALHARKLGLVHPTTREELTWESPLPQDLNALLVRLRGA